MKRFIALLVMAAMVLSTAGAASAATVGQVYEICGSTNPDATGNVADIANSGVAFTAIGATYPTAVIKSGTESLITDAVKAQGGTWIVLVGGPVANSISKELVDAGKIPSTLNGYMKVLNAWGATTANVMAIWGPERDDTQAACSKYAADLRAGVDAAKLEGAVSPVTRTFLLNEDRTEIWQRERMGTDFEADGLGDVVTTNNEINIETEGTVKGGFGNTIEIKDFKQKSGQAQQISYGGTLTVQPDYTVEGTLTGTFTGSTSFGTMQSGVVTMKATDENTIAKRLYDFTLENGIYTIVIDDDVDLELGETRVIVDTNNLIYRATLEGAYTTWPANSYFTMTLLTNNRVQIYLVIGGVTVIDNVIIELAAGKTVPTTSQSETPDFETSGIITNEIDTFEWDGIEFSGDISGNIVA